MSDNKKLIERIKALLAKAAGTDNEHEADAFMSKAQALMEEHQIALGDIHGLEDDVVADRPGFEQAAGSHVWVSQIYGDLARLYGCRVWVNRNWSSEKGERKIMHVVGRESAHVTLELMHPFVVKQVRDQAKRLAAITGMSVQGQAKRIGAALRTRIWQLIREQEAAADAGLRTEAARSNALITTNAVLALYEDITKDMQKRKGRAGVTDGLARAAAGKVSLARQVGTGTQLKLK